MTQTDENIIRDKWHEFARKMPWHAIFDDATYKAWLSVTGVRKLFETEALIAAARREYLRISCGQRELDAMVKVVDEVYEQEQTDASEPNEGSR